MSDWKSRAIPADEIEAPAKTGSWRDRAVSADAPVSVETPDESSILSDLGDLGLGSVQGATMGGADEIGGGMSALLDLAMRGTNKIGLTGESPSQVAARLKAEGFTGDVGPDTLGAVYRQGQQNTEKMFDAAEERSPYLYGTGNIAGAVGTGILTGGAAAAGLANAGIQTGSKLALSQAAKLGGKTLAKELGKRAAMTAAIAAPEGLVTGALSSEGNLDSIDGAKTLAGDAALGTLTSSVLGGGLSLAADVIPAAAKKAGSMLASKGEDIIQGDEYLRVLNNAREYGKKGINVYNEANHKGEGLPGVNLSKTSVNHATDLMEKLVETDRMIGKKLGDSLVEATNKGVKVDVDPMMLKSYKDIVDAAVANKTLIQNPDAQKVFDKILTTPNGKLNPTELKSVMENMDELWSNLAGDTTSQANTLRKVIVDFRRSIQGSLEASVPAYKSANTQFKQFRTNVIEPFLRKETPDEFSDLMYGKLRNKDSRLFGAVKQTLEGASRPGVTTGKSRVVYGNVREGLDEIASNPANADVMQSLGITKPQDFMDRITKAGDESNMIYRTQRHDPQISSIKKLKDTIIGRDEAVWAANKVGLVQNKFDKVASTVSKVKASPAALSRKLYNLTDDGYNALVTKLGGNPSTSAYADSLKQAIESSDIPKRNAVIFSMLQNPNIRQNLDNDEEENTEEVK